MITVVCVYNNKQTVEHYLLKTLEQQAGNHQLVLIDNTRGQFSSAARALNEGARQAKGEYIMFVHQDVDLDSSTWLNDAERILDSLGSFGVAGVAGMSEEGKNNKERGRNVIRHLEDRRVWEWANPIDRPERVQTVDGCLFITPKTVYDAVSLDEQTCDSWHLYDVDYCLSCEERGFEVFAIPLSIYHRSTGGFFKQGKLQIAMSLGSLPEDYYRTLSRVSRKHRRHFRKIYTTCGDYSTTFPVTLQRFWSILKGGLRLATNPKLWKS